ncbi:uncharacterized protein G2W53_033161 [Senna tora]|uniref:Uncharacterized protein n=1 Tax=Senna tora TaxID=362788 RepID=A0A834SXQ0_9FABA|nr:uncharacterized protein G2W53_033161 [Senna tora]
MPPRRRTLRSVASDARVRGGRASQTTRESIPAETENRHPPRRSAFEAAVVGLQGVVEALTGQITEQRAEDAPQVTPEKCKWGNEGKSLVQDGSAGGSKLQNRAHTIPEAPTSSTKSAGSVTRSKSEARGVGLSSFQGSTQPGNNRPFCSTCGKPHS